MDAQTFENARWQSSDQKVQFRHHASLNLISEGTVLDVGCGDGLFLNMLKEKGIDARGVDFSGEAIQKCATKGVQASKHDLSEPLPFPDGTFDWVVALDVLEHQYDPLSLLKEMTRVSRRNVIVGVPNFSSLPARLQTLSGMVPENNKPHKGHVYWFNYSVLLGLAAKARLEITKCAMNTFRPATVFGGTFPNLFPNLFALSFVAHFTKRS
jgi:methionine biosynthesis protein MetW